MAALAYCREGGRHDPSTRQNTNAQHRPEPAPIFRPTSVRPGCGRKAGNLLRGQSDCEVAGYVRCCQWWTLQQGHGIPPVIRNESLLLQDWNRYLLRSQSRVVPSMLAISSPLVPRRDSN